MRPKIDWLENVKKQNSDNDLLIDTKDISSLSTNLSSNKKLKVFLCHSALDKDDVRELYHNLVNKGFEPWFNEEDLLPGQDWKREISRAVRTSLISSLYVFLDSLFNKKGYVHKEIKIALDVADEQPEGTIFLVPIRLEDCLPPDRLGHFPAIG